MNTLTQKLCCPLFFVVLLLALQVRAEHTIKVGLYELLANKD